MKLLIIDDDRDLVEMLASWLKTLSFEVYRAYNAERAKIEWMEHRPDLVILNISLKGTDTLTMCRDMSSKHDALVMVMANGKDVQDEVRYLNAGADDYLRKPFFPSQLLAHIRAVSRRARATLEQHPSSIITVGAIKIDAIHNEVTVDGMTSRLTPTERKILHLLAANANSVCTTNQIVMHVWGYDGEGDASLIKTHIRHLRQKIEPDSSNPRYLLTVPGVGYTLIRHFLQTADIKEEAG